MDFEELREMFGRDIDTEGLIIELYDWYRELDTNKTKEAICSEVLQDVFEIISNNMI